ncbi:unnamed protein product [Fraxinus pennsylvanica]|uniref:Uncharacterized protein n=1 Tax=Fraxinus pennsylvanica TaxID=56036 RepID=A0AAD2A1X3_9LAMI|nr:unnamed protein product [Fraxinus pennsylvanica]
MGKIGSVKVSQTTKDLDHIKSDVASFASSLGFSSAPSSSAGFNDSDFHKTGPLKPHSRPPKNSYIDKTKIPHDKENKNIPKNNNKRSNPKFDVKSPQIQTPNFSNGDSKFKNLPKLPLLKASAMSVWYKDAALLEEKVIGDNKRIEFKSVDEWKGLVEEKKNVGERLMAQYVREYESSRGQSGDIKMLIATQRSGTAADKVGAAQQGNCQSQFSRQEIATDCHSNKLRKCPSGNKS